MYYIIPVMPLRTLVAAAVLLTISCGSAGLFRQYEYEEDVYLSLDGTATVYVNSSVAALNALRGTSFDADPGAAVDLAAVRSYFTTPLTRVVGRVTTSARNNRRYVHLRVDVDEITRLGETAPFAWSRYDFTREDDLYVYRQRVGSPAGRAPGDVGWTGRELVGFRLHVPSKIDFHNTLEGVGRGNILVWEQSLEERLGGTGIAMETRMEIQSILYRTLWLFGWTLLAVAATFGVVIWRVVRRAPAGASGGYSRRPAGGSMSRPQ